MYLLMKSMAAVISRMSDRTIHALTMALAILVFDVLRLRRRLVTDNLGIAFPEMPHRERVRTGRMSVYHFLMTAMELLRSYRTDIAKDIEVRGVEHIRGALDKQKGVYILCFHLGNWEAMGAQCTRMLCPSYVLVKKVGTGGLDRFVTEVRDKNQFLSVKRQKKGDGFTAIKEILAAGHIVGFVMDQARPGEPKLPYFGHPAKTNTSLAAIWRKVPAPIVPAFIRRVGVSKHILEFFPEVPLSITQDAEQDVLRHSTEFNAIVESHVRKHPEEYFWMHNRWK